MAIRFICEHCPKQLKAKDRDAGDEITCPRCGGVCVVPEYTDEHLLDAKALRKQARAPRAALERALAHFRAGVMVHFATVVLTGVGLWFCWFGFAVLVAQWGLSAGAARVGNVLVAIGVLLFLAVAVLEQVTGYLCNLPIGGRRVWLWISIGLRKLVLATGVAYWFADEAAVALAVVVLALSLLAWIFWLVHVKEVLWLFWQDDLKGHLTTTLIFGPVVAVVMLVVAGLLTTTFTFPHYGVRIAFGAGLLFSAFVLVGAAYFFSRDKTLLQIVLYPTGLTYLLDYFNTLSSVRLVLGRRV